MGCCTQTHLIVLSKVLPIVSSVLSLTLLLEHQLAMQSKAIKTEFSFQELACARL